MTRRDWWAGILVLSAVLLAHGFANRYSWQVTAPRGSGVEMLLRIDNVTGELSAQPIPFLRGELVNTRFEPSPRSSDYPEPGSIWEDK
jgi:hypothetical protein